MSRIIYGNQRGVEVYKAERVLIFRKGDLVEMSCFEAWKSEHLRLAEKYEVNSVVLADGVSSRTKTIRCLLDLPDLRAAHIIVRHPVDMTAISGLTKLEYLGIQGVHVEDVKGTLTPEVDFTPLTRLRAAFVEYCRPFESLLRCASLEALSLGNTRWYVPIAKVDVSGLPALRKLHMNQWRKLKRLDLSGQRNLKCLILEGVSQLQPGGMTLHPEAKIKSFAMGRCGPYRIDWERMGNDLEDLELQGGIRFPLEDILQAPNLRKFSTYGVRKFPPLRFLLELKKLERFYWFAAPPGPKFSQEDREVMEEIKARNPHGAPPIGPMTVDLE